MTERYGDPRFYALLDEIAELHSRKNHDYSKQGEPLSNFKRSEAFGVEPWRGIFVRMSDKWSRIEELSKGKVAKNESLRDSLIDNAVYSLLGVLLLPDEHPIVSPAENAPVFDDVVMMSTTYDPQGPHRQQASPRAAENAPVFDVSWAASTTYEEVVPVSAPPVVEGWQAAAQHAVESYRPALQAERYRAIEQTEGGFGFVLEDHAKAGPKCRC